MHPTQRLEDEPDGSLIVRFKAGGFLEIAHHLMTWVPSVTILRPKALAELMREQVAALYEHHCALLPLRPGEGVGGEGTIES